MRFELAALKKPIVRLVFPRSIANKLVSKVGIFIMNVFYLILYAQETDRNSIFDDV